jgi:uncharacterized RDD family membrane protein YckC
MADAGDWAGKRLGLPETGARSVARLGRRLIAIVIDWALALVVSVVFFHYNYNSAANSENVWLVPAVFAVMQILFIAIVSGSIGHLITGLRVVPLQPGWVGVLKPAVRTVLLCFAIPALIWDRDQRGLHDKIAGTVLVRK